MRASFELILRLTDANGTHPSFDCPAPPPRCDDEDDDDDEDFFAASTSPCSATAELISTALSRAALGMRLSLSFLLPLG